MLRHKRITIGTKIAAALCALGLSAAVATIAPHTAQATISSYIPQPSSLTHHCAPKQIVAIPGGANTAAIAPDKASLGMITAFVGIRLGNQPDSNVTYVPYQSFGFAAPPYPVASDKGYARASDIISRIQRECPHSSISLVGYSLGADIAARIINDAAHGRGVLDTQRFASAVLYSSPYHGGNGAAQYPQKPDNNTGSLGQLAGGFGTQGTKVLEVCHSADAICTFPDKYRGIVPPSMGIDILHGKVPLSLIRELVRYNPVDYAVLARGFISHINYGINDYNVGVDWINTH
ncbi:cutinase family protein [Corynebacterium macginleyi]|uniref:cutinase family protein n=1 Tax=Corynebacterium macginleyi TaxID=38290 RepID=UPI00190A64A7|nr:cutinase family protein [Corynebacterium macginleyi]MBK4142406.1 cutinase family protein [Corynebacterium macginleyi]